MPELLESTTLPLVTPDTRVKMPDVLFRREGEEYVVGWVERALYVSMPAVGVDAIRLLQQNLTVDEVSRRLQNGNEQALDIADFVETLIDTGLVLEVDGRAVNGSTPVMVTLGPSDWKSPARGLAPQGRLASIGRFFTISWLPVHAAAFAAVLVMLWIERQYFPASGDLFVFPWYAVNTVVLVATIWLSALVHETGHLAAAAALGIRGRLSLGQRLCTLAAETVLEDIWQFPREKRIVVYAAGMIVNLWIFVLALTVLIVCGAELSSPLAAWLKMLMFVQFYGVAWQFRWYMRTDVYYIVADLFYAKNLMGETQSYLCALASKVVDHSCRPSDLSRLPKREQTLIRFYAPFVVLGVVYTIWLISAYILPYVWKSMTAAVAILQQGPSAGIVAYADALVMIGGPLAYGMALLWVSRARLSRLVCRC